MSYTVNDTSTSTTISQIQPSMNISRHNSTKCGSTYETNSSGGMLLSTGPSHANNGSGGGGSIESLLATTESESDELLRSKIVDNSNGNIYSTSTHCPYHHDGILCWPETVTGSRASLPCMDYLHGIPYNTSGSATRICESGGVWNKTDYLSCEHIYTTFHNGTNGTNPFDLDVTVGVYFFGYCLSLTALICAAIIFIAFKELRCLRNTIHSHLIITYILADALWVISLISSVHARTGRHRDRAACVTFILLHYFYLTNFFWMFVEGLYLYVLVVQTFMTESIKLRTYCGIGWGVPLLVVTLWCIIRWFTMELEGPSALITPVMFTVLMQTQKSKLLALQVPDAEQNLISCPWLHENVYDWIYKASALAVLAANMLFLLQIMWVLITKLRSATTPETQQSRKAAKALVVLMPLLGITYVLVLIGPRKVPAYEHVRAFLISTQGFLVALFYCFLNQEVRLALRHRWNRLRNLGPDCACCGCETEQERRQNLNQRRDWSPRSRTESIRLYTPTGNNFRKRESSASETTTMTAVLGSFNGSGGVQGQSIIMTTTGRRFSSTPLQSCKSSNLTMNEDTAFI